VLHYSRLSFDFVTTGATRGTGTTYPSGEPEFTMVFSELCVSRSLVFCVVFCRSLFYVLFVHFHVAIVLPVLLRFTASDYLFCIFKRFL
jgi:hypothetical protein